jgi:hypothetical protein
MRELVFIHGRSQQHKDATALKQEWISSFADGLKKSNLSLPIAESAIHFPYYGDTLIALVDGLPADQVAQIIVKGDNADEQERAFALSVIREIGRQAGLTDTEVAAIVGDESLMRKGPLNWPWVRAIITAIDKHVPFGSGTSIALFTRDVYQYLKNPGIRNRIDAGVAKAIGTAPTVVVAHSLGTVVAYDLLRREGSSQHWRIPDLITLGCPLAVNAIREAVAPRVHPSCIGRWFNAMDNRDIVALYPLDPTDGWDVDPAIENKTDVNNPTSNRHGITGYLSDRVVARRIYDALNQSAAQHGT